MLLALLWGEDEVEKEEGMSENFSDVLYCAVRQAYSFGQDYGELLSENKRLEAKLFKLEETIENLKTENATLRKKCEKKGDA